MEKKTKLNGRRHVNDLIGTEFGGIFDDDGYEIDINTIPKPGLCVTCLYDDTGDFVEDSICWLNRYGQQDSGEFECAAFVRKEW